MRVLSGIFGAFVGIIVGFAGALLFASKVSGGDDFGGAMLCIITVPVGLLVGAVFGVILALRVLSYLQQPDLGGRSCREKTILVASLLFGIPALVVGMFWGVMHSNDPPSDQQLLANFSRHHTEFDHLAAMVRADEGLTRVDNDWTEPHDPQTIGVSPARIAEYRRLLRSVETPRGFQTWTIAGDIEFYYYSTGSAISSDTDKGYAYLVEPPQHLLNSLDDCRPDEKNGVVAYRHIQGSWYLFYD